MTDDEERALRVTVVVEVLALPDRGRLCTVEHGEAVRESDRVEEEPLRGITYDASISAALFDRSVPSDPVACSNKGRC